LIHLKRKENSTDRAAQSLRPTRAQRAAHASERRPTRSARTRVRAKMRKPPRANAKLARDPRYCSLRQRSFTKTPQVFLPRNGKVPGRLPELRRGTHRHRAATPAIGDLPTPIQKADTHQVDKPRRRAVIREPGADQRRLPTTAAELQRRRGRSGEPRVSGTKQKGRGATVTYRQPRHRDGGS
jgi:hypothetical protein